MSRFVCADTTERIQALMFGEVAKDDREQFLRQELTRYVPQLVGKSEIQISDFVSYQKEIYLQGKLPRIGQPIASLNPTFVDSIDSVQFWTETCNSYVRASVKENGYRMQLHIGADILTAFTRQFTRYDLRMFPELQGTLVSLPVMIGDAELVNKRHLHLAGFNRVQIRIPDMTYWPKPGCDKLDDEFLVKYLSSELFHNGGLKPDLELTLAFHGMFAIAHPSTWNQSKEVQMKSLISLCNLPVNYKQVDEVLNELESFIKARSLNARVVERVDIANANHLKEYIKSNEKAGLEGTCVVQSVWDKDGQLVVGPRSIKIKTYETLDCILLGLYLEKKEVGLVEENVRAALLGLYDESLGVYLPAMKINLDPNGVQVKGEEKKKNLRHLRSELLTLVRDRINPDGRIYSLYDAFLMESGLVIKQLFKDEHHFKCLYRWQVFVLDDLPSRSDLFTLYQLFKSEQKAFCDGKAKLSNVARKFIAKYLAFFQMIADLDEQGEKRFFSYFSRIKQIKETSTKLVKPQIVVNTDSAIILETQVFDVKWGKSPYAAGFHSWFGDSFRFNNCFAERVRHDKKTTTGYDTVHSLARMNTPK